MSKKKSTKKAAGTKSKKTKEASKASSYYFGDLKKEKIKDTPVYGWPGP